MTVATGGVPSILGTLSEFGNRSEIIDVVRRLAKGSSMWLASRFSGEGLLAAPGPIVVSARTMELVYTKKTATNNTLLASALFTQPNCGLLLEWPEIHKMERIIRAILWNVISLFLETTRYIPLGKLHRWHSLVHKMHAALARY